MKHLFLIAAGLLLFNQVYAQQKEGTVFYQKVSSPAFTLNGQTQKMPEIVNKYELIFSGSKSIFKNLPRTAEDQKIQSNGSTLGMVSNNTLQLQYYDFDQKIQVRTKVLGTNDYIIEGALPDFGWVISDEIKNILGYACKKATGKSINKVLTTSVQNRVVSVNQKIDTVSVTAWFTSDITSPTGPDKYAGLPGLILQVENAKGTVLFEAVSIKPEIKEKELRQPAKGKKMSTEEFEKEEKKFREESTKAMNGIN